MARNRSEDFAAYPEDHYEDETVPAEFEHYVAGFIGSGDEQFVQIFGELNQDKQVSILTRPGGRVLPQPAAPVVTEESVFQSSPAPEGGCYLKAAFGEG